MHTALGKIQFEGKEALLFKTDELKRFKFITENRCPELATKSNKHSRQIETSIRDYGYLLTFIVVNEKWEVIDGQHRIAALRELKLPAYVIKIDGYNGKELQALNSANEDWSKYQHARYWALKNIDSYVDLLEMCDEFPSFKVGTMATLLSSPEARKPSVFDHGKWEITKSLKTVRTHLTQLMELAEIQPKITSRASAEAYLIIAANPKFNYRRMRENLDSYGSRYWETLSTKEQYLIMYTSIYNHARPIKNRLFFASSKDLEKVAKGRMKKAA